MSFTIPLSAMTALSRGIDVVGNNLANLNTSGYKAQRADFQDAMEDALGGARDSNSVGMGVRAPIVSRQYTQGATSLTGGPLDAAIQGDGFFMSRNAEGTLLLTRSGNFKVDASGYLVTATGDRVQGWTAANGVLATGGAVGGIKLPLGQLQTPVSTTAFTMDLNLDARAADASTFSSPMEIVDSLGSRHTLTATFTKVGPNDWSYSVTIPGDQVAGGTAGTPTEVATGAISFDSNGQLMNPPAGSPISVSIPGLTNGAADLAMNWDLYRTDGTGRLTQFAETSATSGNLQDGIAAAQVSKITLAKNGQVIASFSDGSEKLVGQLALAAISNPDSLVSVGGNNFQIGANTNAPVIGLAGTGGRGSIEAGALESSTVDVAREFTNLIIYQRGYQANSKVITTLDEMAQETINIKR